MVQKNSRVLRIQPDGPLGVFLKVRRKIPGPSARLGQAIFLFPIDMGCLVHRSRQDAPFTLGDHGLKKNTLPLCEKYPYIQRIENK